MLNIIYNFQYWGEVLVIFLLWISSWSLIELTIEQHIKQYKYKMIIYSILFIISSIFILLFADSFLT